MNKFSEQKFVPQKKWGQHFLKRKKIAQRIVEFARIDQEKVLEIGSGNGIITEELARRAEAVYAVEIDKKLCNILSEKNLPNTIVVNDDFLNIDLRDYQNCVIIGNIPYYLTTPIIEKLVSEKNFFKKAVLTVQKEYGERLFATPGKKSYGSITLYVNYYFSVKKGFSIPPNSFYPKPKISSLVILLEKRKPPFPLNDHNGFFDFIRGLFHYRRKSLKNCLRYHLGYLPANLEEAIIKKRPEELGIIEFEELYNRIH